MDPVPVIIFLVEQVITLVEYHDKAVSFREQLLEMQSHLAFMMSYLADTDNLRTTKMLLKATLMNLRDLMYEAEDILTDCQLRDEYRHKLSSLSPNDAWFKHITMDKKLKDINSRMKILENISDESAILEDELKVLMQLDKLMVLAINNVDEFSSSSSNNKVDLKDDHILNVLDRLCPPPNLQELYLKNYRRDGLWGRINPSQLSKLQYLCIEDGNLERLSSGSNSNTQSATSSSWKIEGLCLKLLPRLDV